MRSGADMDNNQCVVLFHMNANTNTIQYILETYCKQRSTQHFERTYCVD